MTAPLAVDAFTIGEDPTNQYTTDDLATLDLVDPGPQEIRQGPGVTVLLFLYGFRVDSSTVIGRYQRPIRSSIEIGIGAWSQAGVQEGELEAPAYRSWLLG